MLPLSLSTTELTGKLESALTWLAGTATGEDLPDDFADLEARLGVSLRETLLESLGSEIALAIDLPALDVVAAAMQVPDSAGYSTIFARSGVLASVRDAESLERDLERMFLV